MSKAIIIKLTKGGEDLGPFTITDNFGRVIAENVPFKALIEGRSYMVEDNVTVITLESIGRCDFKVSKPLVDVTYDEYREANYSLSYKSCMWRHLTDVVHYNFYYGNIEPYIIEYAFSFNYLDEILQNVQDYTKVYEYSTDNTGVFNDNLKVQPNNKWFNKAIVYNDQQSSGMLVLEPKPLHNLQSYNAFPKYGTESKTITYTKSDNFYQYNTFWNVVKNPLIPLFRTSCESLSIDKVLNQVNMDYSTRSFKKDPLRAKDLKIRHILDNSSTTHLVSQFIIAPNQNSYK